MPFFLFKLTLVLNSALPSLILLVFESLLSNSETFLCSMLPHQLTVVVLDMHQLRMLSAGILTYLKQKLFLSVILYHNHSAFQFISNFYSVLIYIFFSFSPLN
jgi:hypothetical protein